MEENQKNNLKVIALREAFRDRVAEITDTYEMRIVDLRVQLTEMGQQVDELTEQLAQMQRALGKYQEAETSALEEEAASAS